MNRQSNIPEDRRGAQLGPDSYRGFCRICGLMLVTDKVFSCRRDLLCSDCCREPGGVDRAGCTRRNLKCPLCKGPMPADRPSLCAFCEPDPEYTGRPIVRICVDCHERISHHADRVTGGPIVSRQGMPVVTKEDEDGFGGHGPAVRALEDADDER